MDRNVYRVASVSSGSGHGRESARAANASDGAEPPPHEKLLKYFPAEALALYVTLDPMVREAADGTAEDIALAGTLVVSAVFCWMFLRKFWKIRRVTQLSISTGSLVLYVAATGGPFTTFDWYKPLFASIAAVLATAFLLFVRTPEKPKP